MALTADDLAALESALASGELTVEYDGKRTTFRSVPELRSAIDYVKGELAAVAGTRTTQSFTEFTRD